MLGRETGLCIKLMSHLAGAGDDLVPLPQLADELEVTRPFAAKLVRRLGRVRLVESRPGVGGGVRLTRRGRSATYFTVANLLRDPAVAGKCALGARACFLAAPCRLHPVWGPMHREFLDELSQSCIAPVAAPGVAAA